MTEILIALIVLMIIGSVVAIATPNVLYSVVSIGAVGFLLSIVFLFLSAPDLAITQIAVEVITLVLLLRATIGTRRNAVRADAEEAAGNRNLSGTLAGVAIVSILAVFSVSMLAEFPEFGQPVMERFADAPSNTYLRDGLEKTGSANIVTAVLLDFRAYDTLGEATVLFCAVVGALTVMRRQAKQSAEEADKEDET